MESAYDIVDAVGKALLIAERYNLQVEVMVSTLTYLKRNPSSSIQEALEYGLNEWDL